MEVLAGAGGGRGDPVFGPLDTRNSRHPKVPRFSRGSFSKPGRFLHFWGPFSGFRGGPKVVEKWSIFAFLDPFSETDHEKTSVLWGDRKSTRLNSSHEW